MSDVSFNTIPGNLLPPFFFAEINSGGSPAAGNPVALYVAQKTTAGVAIAGVPYGPVHSEAEAVSQFGVGSMLHSMFNIARRNAPFQPFWALPLADPAGNAAAGSISINAGTALGVTGAAILRIMGRRIVVQVNAADTAATTAALVIAAINAANLPLTAAVNGTDSFTVDLTARHIGTSGNEISVKLATDEPNVLAAANCTVVGMTGGTGTPDFASALANLGDAEFDWIGGPYSDTTSLDDARDFLDDTAGRWSPMQQLYGHYTTTKFDTLSNLCSFGAGRNDQHATVMGAIKSPTPSWEWAAALAAQEVQHLGTAPELSRPMQTLVLEGVLPSDDRADWWDITDRQALYSNGIAGYRVTVDRRVAIDRMVTTYQKNAANVPDRTFMDTETMAQLMFVPRYFRNAIANEHGRKALADENPFGLSSIVTPKDLYNTCVHAYADLVAFGVAENLTLFAKSLVIVRDGSNANRVNAYIPIDVVNQLRIFAGNFTAFLQFQTASQQAAV